MRGVNGYVISSQAANADTAPPPALPALFGPLFEAGRTFTFNGIMRTQPNDPPDAKPTTVKASTTCSVADVRWLGKYATAVVKCAKTKGGLAPEVSVAGLYVATQTSLWFTEESSVLPNSEADAARIASGAPYIVAAPKASASRTCEANEVSRDESDNEIKNGSWFGQKALKIGGVKADAWCAIACSEKFDGMMVDERERCFAPGYGLVSATQRSSTTSDGDTSTEWALAKTAAVKAAPAK